MKQNKNPPDKVVIVEELLDGIDVDGIGNLVDLPMPMFIHGEYENLKVVVDREDKV